METLCSKDELLKIKLIDFYKNKENLNILLPIILQQTRLSLRSLDWFVTNYCKKNNISYTTSVNGESISYFPFKSYKSQLKAYSKKFCDPFCRRERVIFDYQNNVILEFKQNIKFNHKEYVITTIGQLNFFKWVIDHEIIDYIEQHYTEIECDMNSRNSTAKPKTEKNRKRREELSISASKSIKKELIEVALTFN